MMELLRRGRLLSNFLLLNTGGTKSTVGFDILQFRNYAARKGTRMKAQRKKVKVEIQKLGFIPHKLRAKKLSETSVFESKRIAEEWKTVSSDDVWIARYYRWRLFSFAEAVECHRETHHPTIFNQPEAPLEVLIELDMSTSKPTKFVEKFSRTAMIPHGFDHGEDRTIIVFCKSPAEKLAAEEAGATLVGGTEIIRDIEKGRIMLPDFNFVLAHPDIVQEMLGLRGLLKKRFPNPKAGTVGTNLSALVKKFRDGITYTALRDEKELDYGWIDVTVGMLNMDTNLLEENFKELINDVLTQAPPKTAKPFITRVLLKSPPSVERLKLDMSPYLPKDKELESDTESEDESDNVKVKIVA
ncbi:mitochondrial ribosomal protein L1 [Lycorma delicatula]|uniref:mitochondrial ribosomal protein L1 n=1 Tax=Lycorma delicatula TaxID=130591 RepID=UPI003F51496B